MTCNLWPTSFWPTNQWPSSEWPFCSIAVGTVFGCNAIYETDLLSMIEQNCDLISKTEDNFDLISHTDFNPDLISDSHSLINLMSLSSYPIDLIKNSADSTNLLNISILSDVDLEGVALAINTVGGDASEAEQDPDIEYNINGPFLNVVFTVNFMTVTSLNTDLIKSTSYSDTDIISVYITETPLCHREE